MSWSNLIKPLSRMAIILLANEREDIPATLISAARPYRCAEVELPPTSLFTFSLRKAEEIFDSIRDSFPTYWDDRSNIGKRYKYQDEMGTPFCVTIDYQTLEDNTVTVRERDSMKQNRVLVDTIKNYLQEKII